MNYVNYENMQEILDGIERKIGQGGGSGAGLEDWQAEHEYTEKDICVYEGQIYRAKVGYTSDTTFSTTQILEEYTPVGGETIIPYEQDTEISIDDIVSYDNNTYKALYNFVCGEEFSLFALEEYVPQELTEVQEAEIINHFLPNIYSGGNMSIEDSTPIGTIISFMGTIAPENYLVCDGTVYNIADYIELAEFIKTQFGSYNYFGGDGITTFAVPDLQGEFLRMTGTNSHTNQGSGASVGVHQDGTEHIRMEAYHGSYDLPQAQQWNTGDTAANPHAGATKVDSTLGTRTGYLRKTEAWTPISSGYAYYTSRPTNTSVLYCIKYKMSITNAEEIKDLTTEDIKQIVNSYNPVFEEAKGIEYSTEEQRIGTWIDGKPLYQITIEGTTPSISNSNEFMINLGSYNIDYIVDIKYIIFAPVTYGSTTNRIYFSGSGTNRYNRESEYEHWFYIGESLPDLPLHFRGEVGSALSDKSVVVTLQYTKTTD